jgi:transposase
MVLFILVLYIYCSVHSSKRTFFRYSTMSRRFRLSSSERINIVKWYAAYQSAAEVARRFQHHYERAPPTRESILDITRKFDETGSVQDVSRSGRPRSVSTEENKQNQNE